MTIQSAVTSIKAISVNITENAWFQNITVELAGIIVTVFIIDKLIRRHESQRWNLYTSTYLAGLYSVATETVRLLSPDVRDKNCNWALISETTFPREIDPEKLSLGNPDINDDSIAIDRDTLNQQLNKLRFLLTLTPASRLAKIEASGLRFNNGLETLQNGTYPTSQSGAAKIVAYYSGVRVINDIIPFISSYMTAEEYRESIMKKGG